MGLTHVSGTGVDRERLRGRVALITFGYTHCPDVCPTTLARLKIESGASIDAVAEHLRRLAGAA